MKLTPLTKAIRASIGASLLLSVAMPLMAQDTTEEAELEEHCEPFWDKPLEEQHTEAHKARKPSCNATSLAAFIPWCWHRTTSLLGRRYFVHVCQTL